MNRRRPRTAWAIAWRGLDLLLFMATVAALGVRWTVRDQRPGIAVLFYATPWPVLAFLGLLSAVVSRTTRRRVVALGVGFVAAAGVIVHGCRTAPSREGVDGVRIVFWNLERGAQGWDRLIAELQSEDAELIGLVESTPPARSRAFWKNRFPDFDVALLPAGMTLLVRGEVVRHASHPLGDVERGTANRVVIRWRGEERIIWLVDIVSTPTMFRGPALLALTELVLADRDRPTLVLGDFNTPTDSAFFDDWRRAFTNAHEWAGAGFAWTWPQPVPVLSLDQVWSNEPERLLRCDHVSNRVSDHRRVRVSWKSRRSDVTAPARTP